MAVQLSQKERLLLEDQRSHEDLCVQKYQKYAGQAQDPQLKQLFTDLAQKEQEHLNSINQLLSGQMPNMAAGQQQQQGQQPMQGAQGQGNQTPNKNDEILCQDMLSTEKYVSGTYDTAIFEFADTNIRNILNHIQKEEQEHGDRLFKYMQNKGMYQAQ